ncbi:MAG: DUF4421 domain-containing protein [Bacteroidaceae bacterium]|nr:DUF4421 domain-containing protein [Bacteroidaceae bacterium]
MLEVRQSNPKTDTNYVVKPPQRWTLRLINNVTGTHFTLKMNAEELGQIQFRFRDPLRHTVTLSANYRGLAAALAVNPANLFGKHTSTEFNINAYGNHFGIDFIFERNGNFDGTIVLLGEKFHGKSRIKEKSAILNAYYAFNGRKFSYPAAFSQSYIQKRSAGSFMLGASFHKNLIDVESGNADDDTYYEEDRLRKIKMNYFSLGVGYGYNYVPSRNWLLHLSALPTLVIWRENKLVMMGHFKSLSSTFPEMSVVGRASLVRYYKSFFAGLTLVYNFTSAGDSDLIRIDHFKWRARFILGKRF